MIKITYRERTFIDKYRCIDKEHTAIGTSMFTPEGSSLIYLKVGRYGYCVISIDDIIKIEIDK